MMTKKENMIRIRIIANSNSKEDQDIKKKISFDLKENLYKLLKNERNINRARKKIITNLDNIETIVKEDLKNEEYSYKINYGKNYFPKKTYKNKIYKEGNYESLLITLGKGNGDNWWCILFPPLCLIEVEDKSEDIAYSSFFTEFINKFKNN